MQEFYESKESLQCYPALIAVNKRMEIKFNLYKVAFYKIPGTTSKQTIDLYIFRSNGKSKSFQ